MSIEDVLEEIRKDVTNYLYELSDLNGWGETVWTCQNHKKLLSRYYA
jgi:hypothetical protein